MIPCIYSLKEIFNWSIQSSFIWDHKRIKKAGAHRLLQ